MSKNNENKNVNVNEAVDEEKTNQNVNPETESTEAEETTEKKVGFFGKVKQIATSKPVKITLGCVAGAVAIYGIVKGVGYYQDSKASKLKRLADDADNAKRNLIDMYNDKDQKIADLTDKLNETANNVVDATADAVTDIPVDNPTADAVNDVASNIAENVTETVTE